MRDIAVRGFINDKFNTPFGKGLFRRAVFNGSVELGAPKEKYLVDYYAYGDWENQAKSDSQMQTLRLLADTGFTGSESVFCSWIQHYEPLSKVKNRVDGFSIYSPETQELYIRIDDPAHKTEGDWTLPARLCKTAGVNKPVFVATNIDLNSQAA